MTETKPQMEPGGFTQTSMNENVGTSMPIASPPATVASAASGMISVGSPVPAMVSTAGMAPSLPIKGVASDVSAWQNDKRINGLWSISENRNSWVGVAGIGWKKLANNSDSAIVALTMLSAHAHEKESPVYYREESDGMIHEMYIW